MPPPITVSSLFILLTLALGAIRAAVVHSQHDNACTITPLGNDQDDSEQILSAVAKCGTHGTLVFPENQTYRRVNTLLVSLSPTSHSFLQSIQKLMIWNLTNAHVDLHGTLSVSLAPS